MDKLKEKIIKLFGKLPEKEQTIILSELENIKKAENNSVLKELKLEYSKNEIQKCPHCGSKEFIGWGTDKKIKRYKCKKCNKTFTEYSGTWISHLHKKDLIDKYIGLFVEEKSIRFIASELEISSKTALDWRHKITSSLTNTDKGDFKGITESDETFFLFSEKGIENTKRSPRKRGGKANKAGINEEQVAVIVASDRKTEIDLSVATLGRISKKDVENSIGNRISEKTILCTDSHKTYIGFCIDKKIEHHTIKASKKEYVKDKIYHVQNVNSMDSRLKPWINFHFKGVATKYLQNYLNWFRIKELLKKSKQKVKDFLYKSFFDNEAWSRFKNIETNFEIWLQTTHI